MVSVIIPSYNSDKTIARSIESVLCQTYSNIQIIIVDDGSIDSTRIICDKYVYHSNVKVIHQKNNGSICARITGLDNSEGDFFTFVDSDDWIEPDFIENLMRPFQTDYMIDISVGGYSDDYQGKEPSITFNPSDSCVMESDDAVTEMFSGSKFNWAGCGKIYRRSLAKYYRSWWDESSYGEDTEFNWKAFRHSRAIAYVPEYGYHYCHYYGMTLHVSYARAAYARRYDRILHECNDECGRYVRKLLFDTGTDFVLRCGWENLPFDNTITETQSILRKYFGNGFDIKDKNRRKRYNIAISTYEQIQLYYEEAHHEIHVAMTEMLGKSRKLYLYGTGAYARKFLLFEKELPDEVEGFVVTSMHPGNDSFNGNRVMSVYEALSDDSGFVLLLGQKNMIEVKSLLDEAHAEYTDTIAMLLNRLIM